MVGGLRGGIGGVGMDELRVLLARANLGLLRTPRGLRRLAVVPLCGHPLGSGRCASAGLPLAQRSRAEAVGKQAVGDYDRSPTVRCSQRAPQRRSRLKGKDVGQIRSTWDVLVRVLFLSESRRQMQSGRCLLIADVRLSLQQWEGARSCSTPPQKRRMGQSRSVPDCLRAHSSAMDWPSPTTTTACCCSRPFSRVGKSMSIHRAQITSPIQILSLRRVEMLCCFAGCFRFRLQPRPWRRSFGMTLWPMTLMTASFSSPIALRRSLVF